MERKGIENSSIKVLFVCSGTDEASISPVVFAQGESLRKCGVSVDYFAIGGKGFAAYFKAAGSLRSRLKQDAYGIIHAHYGLSAIVALAAHGKIPIVVSFMGDDLLGSNRIDEKVTMSSRWFSKMNVLLARHFYDLNIVKSEGMLLKLGKNRKAEIVPNGVDVKLFHPIKKQEAQRVTEFTKEKWNFIFIGDQSRPEKNYKLALEAVSKAGSNSELHVVKDRKPHELPYYYSAADAVIITSFHEGSPNILKEAMACNCPVVSTDVGDVRMLSEDIEGHFLTSFDPSDVAGKLISAEHFRTEVGETKGRLRIIERKLDSESVALQIISIYKRLQIN
jgi:glycosyltransferase involved in cell wall biosynthesis